MQSTVKEEQSIARYELLHAAQAVATNASAQNDTVVECFARAVSEYLQAELDCEAEEPSHVLQTSALHGH